MSYFRWLVGLQTSKLARRRDMLMEVVNNFREHRQQKTLALATRAEKYERVWSRLGFYSRTADKNADTSVAGAQVSLPTTTTGPHQSLPGNLTLGEPTGSTSRSILSRLPINWREICIQQVQDAAFSNAQRLNRVRHINKVATGANTVINLPALTNQTPLQKQAKKCLPRN